jgi:hypothetical protein
LLIRGTGKEGMIYIQGCQDPCLFYVTQTVSLPPSKSYTTGSTHPRWPASSSRGFKTAPLFDLQTSCFRDRRIERGRPLLSAQLSPINEILLSPCCPALIRCIHIRYRTVRNPDPSQKCRPQNARVQPRKASRTPAKIPPYTGSSSRYSG